MKNKRVREERQQEITRAWSEGVRQLLFYTSAKERGVRRWRSLERGRRGFVFFLEEAVTSIANEASGLKCKLRLRARSGILGDKKIGKGNGSFKLNWIVVRTLVVYFEFMLFL